MPSLLSVLLHQLILGLCNDGRPIILVLLQVKDMLVLGAYLLIHYLEV